MMILMVMKQRKNWFCLFQVSRSSLECEINEISKIREIKKASNKRGRDKERER